VSGARESVSYRRAAQVVALVRVGALPVLLLCEWLVDRKWLSSKPFYLVLAAAALYALGTLVASIRSPERPKGGFRPYAVLDLTFLAGLAVASGGAHSQVRYAFPIVPLGAGFVSQPRDTAAALVGALCAWLAVGLSDPLVEGGWDWKYVAVQTLGLGYGGGAALALSFVLSGWRRRLEGLARARQELVGQAQEAAERERRKLAYALHDEAIQNLLSAKLELGRVRRGDREAMERAEGALTETVAQLRGATFELHPRVLDELGLEAALRQVAERSSGEGGLRIDVAVDPAATGIYDGLLFSLARELLSNAVRHSHAREVRLALLRQDGQVVLTVQDDGRGFSVSEREAARREGHIGLAASAERVEAAGGALAIRSSPGEGTHVRVSLPERPARLSNSSVKA
jgi:two-component system NarL family sensor kinase